VFLLMASGGEFGRICYESRGDGNLGTQGR